MQENRNRAKNYRHKTPEDYFFNMSSRHQASENDAHHTDMHHNAAAGKGGY